MCTTRGRGLVRGASPGPARAFCRVRSCSCVSATAAVMVTRGDANAGMGGDTNDGAASAVTFVDDRLDRSRIRSLNRRRQAETKDWAISSAASQGRRADVVTFTGTQAQAKSHSVRRVATRRHESRRHQPVAERQCGEANFSGELAPRVCSSSARRRIAAERTKYTEGQFAAAISATAPRRSPYIATPTHVRPAEAAAPASWSGPRTGRRAARRRQRRSGRSARPPSAVWSPTRSDPVSEGP